MFEIRNSGQAACCEAGREYNRHTVRGTGPMLPQKSNRRRFRRVVFPPSVNVRCWGEGFRGRLRILSEGGMFVDTIHPPLDGTEVEVTVEAEGEAICLRCVSRDHEPGSGMGLEFVGLQETERGRIRELIARFNS